MISWIIIRDIFLEINKIFRKYYITSIPIEILLYQTGYLTLRNEYDGSAHLVLTNTEVEESLLKLYLEENNLIHSKKIKQKMKDIVEFIDSRNIKEIVYIFNLILNECVSILSNIFRDERSIRDIIYAALLQIPYFQKIKERETTKGKADLELVTKKTCMVIEFKRTSPTQSPEVALRKTIDQMNQKRYGFLFSETHELYRVAMVVSTDKREILKEYSQEIV